MIKNLTSGIFQKIIRLSLILFIFIIFGLFVYSQKPETKTANAVTNSVAGISSSAWTELGPGNIGGRIHSIVIHPDDPNKMWLGSVSGGIWKTTDAGASWQPVDDHMANLNISTMVMQPGNPNIMYAGTGEDIGSFPRRGAGVFKSTDGGNTWNQLSSTTIRPDWNYVNRLAISPDGSILLAATNTGIFRSTDGGLNWSQKHPDPRVKDIDFNPTNNNWVVASGFAGQAWYSNNGGENWTSAPFWPPLSSAGRLELAYTNAPGSPGLVYASVATNSGEIWKSTDYGTFYTLENTGDNYLGGQADYNNSIWIDPTDENTIVVGGTDLWISRDGGKNLTNISYLHADQHVIASAPGFDGNTNKRVFVGNDGGIYKTDDIYNVGYDNQFQKLNNNLRITQVNGAAGNPTSGVIVAGAQDNGNVRYAGAGGFDSWTPISTAYGDGGFVAADPIDPYFYMEQYYLRIVRSTNNGISTSSIYSGLRDAEYGTECAKPVAAPFILDPNNSNIMLAGGCSLWRSRNIKDTIPNWFRIKDPLLPSKTYITAIAVAPGNSDIIWVGYEGGIVYKTLNGTADAPIWTQVNLNIPNLFSRDVTRLTIDRINPDVVYISFTGYRGFEAFVQDNVWRTIDNGITWNDISGPEATGLPATPVNSLVIHPDRPDWLYVGTAEGIFASEDNGTTWAKVGPANVAVAELFWMNNTLYAATYGRGVFKVDVTLPSPTPTPDDLIFANSFEEDECSLSDWSSCVTDNGDLSFTEPTLLSTGNSSLNVLIDDIVSIYAISTHPIEETRYRARFYFDPNSITMAASDTHNIFVGRLTSGTAFIVQLNNNTGTTSGYRIRTQIYNDLGNNTLGTYYGISDDIHFIEIDWKAATGVGINDGYIGLWIDDAFKGTIPNIDNDSHKIEEVRLGAAANIKAGTHGTYFIDAFESRRLNKIGPVEPSGTPTPTATPGQSPTPTPLVSPSPSPILTPTPTPITPISPTPTPSTGTVTVYPTADSYVSGASAYVNKNYGSTTTLKVDGSPINISYMKFDLTGLAGRNITNAKLRIKVTNSTSHTQNIKETAFSWVEGTITYNNRPALETLITSFVGGPSGVWKEIDLTDFVNMYKGNIVSFGIDSTGGDNLVFNSRNASASIRPHLVVQ